jgi:plasmid stabilization system protein ParE
MRYTVVWTPTAQQELARIWTAATDRNAVSAASNRIDYLLARNPHGVGESRSASARLLIVEPLAVLYRVEDEDCLVTLGVVWAVK